GQNGVSATINRGNSTAAFSQTYSLPLGVASGTYTVDVQFWPLEDGGSNDTGTPVGTASSTVAISAGPLSLSPLQLTGNVVSVAALSGQTVPAGATVQLNAAAYTSGTPSANSDLVVTPGSITWQLVTGDGSMTITPDGHVSATAAGSITVTATIDGIVS